MREQTSEWVATVDPWEEVAGKPLFACLGKQGSESRPALCQLPSVGLSSQELEASMQRKPSVGVQKDLAVRFKLQCCGLWAQPTTDSL